MRTATPTATGRARPRTPNPTRHLTRTPTRTQPRPRPDAHAYAHRNPNRDLDAYAHAHRNPDRDPHGNGNILTDHLADANCHAYAYCHAHSNRVSIAHCDDRRMQRTGEQRRVRGQRSMDIHRDRQQAGYSTGEHHTGARSARFGLLPGAAAARDLSGLGEPGGSEVERNLLGELAALGGSYSSGYQTISVPSTADKVTLTFGTIPAAMPRRATIARGAAAARHLRRDQNAHQGAGARPRVEAGEFRSTAYRGSLVLYIEVFNDSTGGTGRTWRYVDDVSVWRVPSSRRRRPRPLPLHRRRPRRVPPPAHLPARRCRWSASVMGSSSIASPADGKIVIDEGAVEPFPLDPALDIRRAKPARRTA